MAAAELIRGSECPGGQFMTMIGSCNQTWFARPPGLYAYDMALPAQGMNPPRGG